MENKCLVTKLSAKIDNPNLEYFGKIKIIAAPVDSVSWENSDIYINSGETPIEVIALSGSFTLGTGADVITEYTLKPNSSMSFRAVKDGAELLITKYGLARFASSQSSRGNSRRYTSPFGIDDILKFCDKDKFIDFSTSYCKYNTESLIYAPKLHNTALTSATEGKLLNLAKCPKLIRVCSSYNPGTKNCTVEEFVAELRKNGRTTGVHIDSERDDNSTSTSIFFENCQNTFSTYKGNEIPYGSYLLEWTEDSINFRSFQQ